MAVINTWEVAATSIALVCFAVEYVGNNWQALIGVIESAIAITEVDSTANAAAEVFG